MLKATYVLLFVLIIAFTGCGRPDIERAENPDPLPTNGPSWGTADPDGEETPE